MYTSHMAQTSAYALSNPDALVDTALMVVLSIRQRWALVGDQLADVRANGADSKYLFSHKKDAYSYLKDNKDSLYNETIKHRDNPEELIKLWIEVPNLGLVKAGFIVQLATGGAGCLDSHNIKLYGVKPNVLVYNKKALEKTKTKKIKEYIKLCEKLGGSVALWSNWCILLASKNEKVFKDGEHVSQLHIDYLTG